MVKILYETSLEDVTESVIRQMLPFLKDIAYAKYEGHNVPSEVACWILKVSSDKLYALIKAGKIIPTERTGKKYQFDLKYLLTWS